MRYFRCNSGDNVYEDARLGLDQAWGHPNAETRTQTCIEPAATAPRDSQGRIVLAVNDEFCTYSVAAELLPQLLASGAVEEITEAEYQAAVNQHLP
jgi:hypothetical protein